MQNLGQIGQIRLFGERVEPVFFFVLFSCFFSPRFDTGARVTAGAWMTSKKTRKTNTVKNKNSSLDMMVVVA